MRRYAILVRLVSACLLSAAPMAAQEPTVPTRPAADTLFAGSDTLGPSLTAAQRRARLVVASGKTYNRVEGLPAYVGPSFVTTAGGLRFSADLFAVLRSAGTFKLDSPNIGHLVSADVRTAGERGRGVGLRLASYDLVTAVEDWQMPRGEAGIAAFFLHRDYRDHFGRHGGSVTASLFAARTTLEVGFAAERWSSRETRQVLTVLRNNHRWRPNPTVDDGHAKVLTARAQLDTRNDVRLPTTGWLLRGEYEYGRADFTALGPTTYFARDDGELRPRYGRALFDLRRYNRLSPGSNLNFRLVAGGWVHGDELPLQRRLSVGGPATIPGIRFRDTRFTPDVYTCSGGAPPPGSPAQCERVLLLQTEYREELPFRPGTILGGTPLRIRSASLTLRPVLVAFVDIGRGWLLPRPATLPPILLSADAAPPPAGLDVIVEPPADLVYGKGRLPPPDTFSSDVGLGVDLGLLGAYLAVSVSESGTPVNFILRARTRF